MDLSKLKNFVALASDYRYLSAMQQLPSYREVIQGTLKSLEGEFGCRLFAEGSNYTVLTPKGRVLLEWAEKFLQLEKETKAAVAAATDEDAGAVRILSSFTPFVDKVRSFFAERMPEVKLYCSNALAKDLNEQALGKLADILITPRSIVSPDVECTLVTRDLFGVFLPANSEYASMDSLPFEVLNTGKYVRTQMDASLEKGTFFDWYFEKRDSYPKYVLTEITEEALRKAMLENGYWRFGTELYAPHVDLPGFTFVPFATGACMYIYVSVLKQCSPLVRRAADLLKTDYTALMNSQKGRMG